MVVEEEVVEEVVEEEEEEELGKAKGKTAVVTNAWR